MILPIGTRRVWRNDAGEFFTTPANVRTCLGVDGGIHLLFAPFDPWMVRVMTVCGVRVDTIPGDGEVTCRECLEAQD